MESVDNLEKFLADIWLNIATLLRESVVYIDHAAIECLHWYTGGTGYIFLKNAGAVAVYELAMYNSNYPIAKNCKNAVIISTSKNPFFYQHTIKMIMENNAFEHCTIVTAAHPNVLNYEDRLDYVKLKRDVKNWMCSNQQSQDCSVKILFQPIFISLIDNNLFVTPPFSDLLPPLDSTLIKDFEDTVDHLVNLFDNLFTCLNLREDIYSLGKFSEYVAEKLETSSVAINRRNNLHGAKDKGVSLIFIDRTLDLCTPTSNNTESLLAKVLCTLPHLPHHHNDVTINMSPIFRDPQDLAKFIQIPGCLANNDKSLMNMLIMQKQKDILIATNKMVIDILGKTKKNPDPKLITRVSAHSLNNLANNFKEIKDFHVITESSKKLQMMLAIIQALKSEKTSQLELLISFEKLILQNIAVSREYTNVLAQIGNIIKTRKQRCLDTENILTFLIYIYALVGTELQFSLQQEQQLKEAIAVAISEDIMKLNKNTEIDDMSIYQQTLLLFGVTDTEAVKKTSMTVAERILNILHEVAQQRTFLHDYTSLMSKSTSEKIIHRVGLLKQLLSDVLYSKKCKSLTLHQTSASFISTGFNLLSKGSTKHCPCDNNWIIIYVIGGITPEEVKEVREVASLYNAQCKITIAGSRLITPLDILDKVILSSIVH